MRGASRHWACALVAGPLLLFAFAFAFGERVARADGPLGRNGAPIRTSNYSVDLFQGPVLASSRITALGGAYTALADGSEGIPFNAAAASLRAPYSTTRDDFDLTAGITFSSLPVFGQASVIGTDFYNRGRVGFTDPDFVWASLGAELQHDHWGIGMNASAQQYEVGAPPGTTAVKSMLVRLVRVDAVTSYGFFDDQLHMGGGLRGVAFASVDTTSGEQLLFQSIGAGVESGALWTPRHLPLRAGITIRSPIFTSVGTGNVDPDGNGDRRVGDFYLPSKVELPWELEWGVAMQLGPRPLNPKWVDEDTLTGPEVDAERRIVGGLREPAYKAARRILKARYRALPREKVLLTFSTLVTGPVDNAVGFDAMLERVVDRSGERPVVTTRAGVEAEALPNRLQLRLGTYVEPTRFEESSPRLHGTAGFELRVLDWDVFSLYPEDTSFRISAAVDRTRDYFSWSFGFGLWH